MCAGVKFEAKDYSEIASLSAVKELSLSGSYAIPVPSPGWNVHADRDPFNVAYTLAHKFKKRAHVPEETCAAIKFI